MSTLLHINDLLGRTVQSVITSVVSIYQLGLTERPNRCKKARPLGAELYPIGKQEGQMLYIYLVVMFLNGNHNTYTPNLLFNSADECEVYKTLSLEILEQNKHDKGNHYVIGLCVPLGHRA